MESNESVKINGRVTRNTVVSISLVLSLVGASLIGGVAYGTIRERISRQERTIDAVIDHMVPRAEHEVRWEGHRRQMARIEQELKLINRKLDEK